ncbi:glycosyltransferase family 2 protein [Spirosoma sp. KNUC1025]|uniref:glycosyltransferase family 2 protein n=1 Tax=Spirosoma sp. KNUC1025 TaxID=2894082 RepID=UPI003865A70A|nr:glycosyltransferase [Spirosoma sp. KNUC1025]
MFLSIIIPTCNRNDLLSQCLNCLAPKFQSIDHYMYEVIITDDSKKYAAKSLIEDNYKWATWVKGPQKGPASNRNNGARLAKGKWLVFLDDDCLPQSSWIDAYVNAINANDGVFVFEGKTNTDRPKQRFDEESPININGNNLWSCNFAILKDFFWQLNGFDELFPYPALEDVDFATRVKKKINILFVPQALVIHPWRRVKLFKTFKKYFKSHIYYAKKYNVKGTFNYRMTRFKIFLGSSFYDLKELINFSMKGWPIYLEKCFLNFMLIFI